MPQLSPRALDERRSAIRTGAGRARQDADRGAHLHRLPLRHRSQRAGRTRPTGLEALTTQGMERESSMTEYRARTLRIVKVLAALAVLGAAATASGADGAVLRGDAACTRCHDEGADFPVFA